MPVWPDLNVRVAELTEWSSSGEHAFRLIFRIKTVSPTIGPAEIRKHMDDQLGLAEGETYEWEDEIDLNSVASSPVIEPIRGNRTNWTFTIDYSEGKQREKNPLEEPPSYERFVEPRERVLERDIHGKPIRNSASDRYDEIITVDSHRTVLQITKNFDKWPQSNYRFMNTVNREGVKVDDEVYGPRQIRLKNMRDARKYSDLLKVPIDDPFGREPNELGLYFAVTLEFCFAEDDWQLVMLDQGLRQSYARWKITYPQKNGRDESIGGFVYQVADQIVRAETQDQAMRNWVKANPGVIILRIVRLANAFEPCRTDPPETPQQQGGGEKTTLPMLLDGNGRQQTKVGTEVWRKYQGYFEYDFNQWKL